MALLSPTCFLNSTSAAEQQAEVEVADCTPAGSTLCSACPAVTRLGQHRLAAGQWDSGSTAVISSAPLKVQQGMPKELRLFHCRATAAPGRKAMQL